MTAERSASEGSDPSLYKAWVDQPIRYNDVDIQGHVNNTVFPIYFEAGRLALNRGAGSPPFEVNQGAVVAQVTVRYLKPVTANGRLRVGTRVSKIGNSSWVIAQGLFDGETPAALCETVLVCMDLQTGASVPLSAERRAYLEGFCSETPP